jgi:CDP-diglyceride synthetase
MGTFDGRGLALGIAGGVAVGMLVWFLTGSSLWIGILAAIGAVIGMNAGFGGDGV